ncbi:hypothetical protein CERSUDRAFT_113409 [Gelatoporia subvermispora B]|uniref:Uncharacterized protein n=1 Tax=Ceriporiopsis subvermispora (strain B) TaxID=914234 RepID=M2R156_CERS8|nr:hypothetical protein CERSUDRAFT_113409 [Gelatoporia subvermispora B]
MCPALRMLRLTRKVATTARPPFGSATSSISIHRYRPYSGRMSHLVSTTGSQRQKSAPPGHNLPSPLQDSALDLYFRHTNRAASNTGTSGTISRPTITRLIHVWETTRPRTASRQSTTSYNQNLSPRV